MILEATRDNPFHLSCKTLIIKDNLCLMNYAKNYVFSNGMNIGEFYSLVRETMENGESPEQTLVRGAAEELGVTIQPLFFIGSSEFQFNEPIGKRDYAWTKTSLYFVSEFIADDQKERVKGSDLQHEQAWVELARVPEYLNKFRAFGGELERDAEIVQRWFNSKG